MRVELLREVERNLLGHPIDRFALTFIVIDGKKVFATEDLASLRRSPAELASPGAKVVLVADRNSMETLRFDDSISIEREPDDRLVLYRSRERAKLAECAFDDWRRAVEALPEDAT